MPKVGHKEARDCGCKRRRFGSVRDIADRRSIRFSWPGSGQKRREYDTTREISGIDILAHQFWFSYPPPGASTSRSQADDEKKEKKDMADAVAKAEQQQKQIQLRADQLDRESLCDYKLERHSPFVGSKTDASDTSERDSSISRYSQLSADSVVETVSECRTNSIQSVCRAPKASLECMEDLASTPDRITTMKVQFLPPPKSSAASSNRRPSLSSSGLRYRNLGKSGLRVSNIGFGTWSTFSDDVVEEQAEAIIGAAYEAGINLFDLSELHSGEKCEIELGKILKKKGWKRSSYIIVTKIYWHSRSEERGLSRKHIIDSVRSSLLRLQLHYIDVVIIHKADPMCPTEEVVRAINHVISCGWAMYWGTARWTPYEIMDAYTNCRQFNCVTPVVEQTEYHMFCREKAELYMPETYNKIGVGLMVWSPISMGMISSDLPFIKAPSMKNKCISFTWSDDETRFGTTEIISWWLKDRSHCDESGRQLEKLKNIAQIAERLDCSLTQLCIAWCLKNESVQCLLLGATSVRQLYHTLQSLKLVSKLNPNIMAEVERTLENKPTRPPIISTLALR